MEFILITSFFTGDVEWRFSLSDIHLRILTMLALTMLYTDEQEKGEHDDESGSKIVVIKILLRIFERIKGTCCTVHELTTVNI